MCSNECARCYVLQLYRLHYGIAAGCARFMRYYRHSIGPHILLESIGTSNTVAHTLVFSVADVPPSFNTPVTVCPTIYCSTIGYPVIGVTHYSVTLFDSLIKRLTTPSFCTISVLCCTHDLWMDCRWPRHDLCICSTFTPLLHSSQHSANQLLVSIQLSNLANVHIHLGPGVALHHIA